MECLAVKQLIKWFSQSMDIYTNDFTTDQPIDEKNHSVHLKINNQNIDTLKNIGTLMSLAGDRVVDLGCTSHLTHD